MEILQKDWKSNIQFYIYSTPFVFNDLLPFPCVSICHVLRHHKLLCRLGARPTNDISIEFEIRSELGAL